ncbi:MAG: hypothetical protein JO002_13460 [Burkholderiaceae bacterium]|nr:hypothetical protein [Burkholderiaceae bacterium]
MKLRKLILIVATLAAAASLSGCIVVPAHGYYGYHDYHGWDHDHDRGYDRH